MSAPTGLYPACNIPWIDTVVNKFAANTTEYNQADLMKCCTAPGECSDAFSGGCPYGSLSCTVGNSRYACRYSNYETQDGTCFHEGSLAVTRSLPCCPSLLTDFLKTESCMSGFSLVSKSTVCCKDDSDPASCQWVLGCIGYTSFNGIGGQTTGVYYGFNPSTALSGSPYCVQEVSLGNEVGPDCLAMSFPQSGCALGGSGQSLAPLPPAVTSSTSTQSSRPSQTTGVSMTPTPTRNNTNNAALSKKKGAAKWAVLLLIAPSVLQLLFL